MLVFTLVAVMAGCSNGQSGNPESADASENRKESKDEKVVLNFIRWSNGPALDAEEEDKVKRFNEARPNIQVKMTLFPWDETFKKIELSLASKEPVDLFWFDLPVYAFYKKGLIKNLQPYFDRDINLDEYDAKLWDPYRFDGKNLYVGPDNYGTLAFYYNKDLFDKAGVEYPNENWTWDDVLVAAKKLTVKEGNETVQFGLDPGALTNWWGWMILSWEQGGEIVDQVHDPTQFTFNTPQTVNALQYLQDLVYKHGVAPDAAQRNALAGDFMTGKIAMYVGGDWDLGTLKEVKDFKWDMVPLPKWGENRVVPYWIGAIAISEKSAHPDEAWEFIRWSMTENQETLAKQQSWIPIHKPALQTVSTPDWAPEGYRQTRYEWMKYGKIGDIYHLKWREVQDKAISPLTDQIFNNKISPAEGLKQMDKQANDILAGN